jgi:3-hydroxyisobutyrate dehydrogenase/glyoxylate/succinic semialdehyde reductase
VHRETAVRIVFYEPEKKHISHEAAEHTEEGALKDDIFSLCLVAQCESGFFTDASSLDVPSGAQHRDFPQEVPMKIGFIGLGIMGGRMAANLLKKGHELVVYNRTRDKAGPLLKQGAVWADSPRAVGEQVTVLFTMLSKPDAVAETALLGKDAFLMQMPKNAIWVDCSTVNPSFSKLMAMEAKERHVRCLDAPVGGSKGPAEQGQLLFFVGGEKKDVDEIRPLFEAMGKTVYHIGGHGMGSAMKMVNNLILGQAMVAFSEAAVLAESLGIPKKTFFDTIAGTPVIAPFLMLKRGKIEEEKFDVEFPLQWMHKDLQLASDTAYETGVVVPSGNIAKEIFGLAMRAGLGEQDFSAVYNVLAGER